MRVAQLNIRDATHIILSILYLVLTIRWWERGSNDMKHQTQFNVNRS